MKVFIGLGNPGEKFQNNRHNVGFILLDHYLKGLELELSKNKKLNGWIAKLDDKLFIKPDTFMNSSGDCVSKVVNFFNVPLEDLIIMHDDVDLEFGKVVFKKGSSPAGHHGVEDIVQKLGSKDFWRYRVGVGRPPQDCFDVTDWVLSDLNSNELEQIKNIPFPIS